MTTGLKLNNKLEEINLTDVLTLLIGEILNKEKLFQHIDLSRLLVCIAKNRKAKRYSLYAKLQPLKFEGGNDILKHSGKYYSMPKIMNNGIEQLYVIYFYIPRFFDLPPIEKLRVIFHELYHISPQFNGGIRRMGKVKHAHGHSKNAFDLHFERELQMFNDYISTTAYYNFLKLDTKLLSCHFSKISGRKIRIPHPQTVLCK